MGVGVEFTLVIVLCGEPCQHWPSNGFEMDCVRGSIQRAMVSFVTRSFSTSVRCFTPLTGFFNRFSAFYRSHIFLLCDGPLGVVWVLVELILFIFLSVFIAVRAFFI